MNLSSIRNITWPHRFYETDQYLAALMNYIPDAIVIADKAGKIVYVNSQAITLFGFDEEELIGKEIEILIPKELRKEHIKLREHYNEYPVMRHMGRDLALHAVNKSGRQIPVDISLSPLQTDKGILTLAMVRDITRQKKAENYLHELNRHLDHLAHHDPLTKLPNRLNLYETVTREISRAVRHEQLLGLLFIDLDYFKDVNDKYGHEVGDLLLVKISQRIKTCIRTEDILARLGGDEFSIVLTELKSIEDIKAIASKVIEQCQQPLYINDIEIKIGVSIGIALAPKDSTTPEELLKLADMAMYKAKNEGRNRFALYQSL
jgi:diguanylate cyclase (GGDEF)-like protein/PAS domain S-box-containing protein